MANQKKEEVYRSKISRTRGDKVFDAVCAVMMVALCLIVAYRLIQRPLLYYYRRGFVCA